MESLDKLGPRRGRPRKFMGPSRAVTLTLPDYVLDALSAIDPDLSRAVVRLTQPELAKQPHPPAELVRFGQSAVIVVNPTRTLEQRTGVNLIPLPDGRAIISFNREFTTAQFELLIDDALEDRRMSRTDQTIFRAIAQILRAARRSKDVTLQERNIIVLESRRPSRSASKRSAARRAAPAAVPG